MKIEFEGSNKGIWDFEEIERNRIMNKIVRLITLARIKGNRKILSSLQQLENTIFSRSIDQIKIELNEIERALFQIQFNRFIHQGKDTENKHDTDIRFGENRSDRLTLVDRSNDPSVSFKYPASVPTDSAFLFIASHERQHVQSIIEEAVLKGKMAHVYVRYFTSYDSTGRLIFVGGLTWGEIIDERR